jgi:predicted Rdx family selenoprotein
VVWDRKEEGGFPESKELKQRVRDYIAPVKFLGHSDKEERSTTREDCVQCTENDPVLTKTDQVVSEIVHAGVQKPNVGINYCTGCRWLLRAAWLAQELLTTFDTEIASVTLIPCSRPLQKGGTFVSKSKSDGQ